MSAIALSKGACTLKHLYPGLAIPGAFLTYIFFVQFFSITGLSPGGFVFVLFVNDAASGFIIDLLSTLFIF